MGKYSSGSDSEKQWNKYSHKSNSHHRSCSSESNSSRNKYKESSVFRGRRSASKGTETHSRYSSHLSHKSGGHRHPKSRRSSSRDCRYRTDSKDRSRSRRSGSRSYIREFVSTKRSSSSSSGSSRDSLSNKTKKIPTKHSINENGSSFRVSDSITFDSRVLDEINRDDFTQKAFSSKSKIPDTIVIDLKKQTIKVPQVEPIEPDSIFHHNLFLSEEARNEKWVKELYSYRQKALLQGNRTNLPKTIPSQHE